MTKISKSRNTMSPAESYELGTTLFWGIGRRKNYRRAFPHLVIAALVGNPYCQNIVGYCYDMGLGVEKSSRSAFQWYKAAARNQNIDGIVNLALCYDLGKGVEANK